jgi:preprotein translocase subunit SecF
MDLSIYAMKLEYPSKTTKFETTKLVQVSGKLYHIEYILPFVGIKLTILAWFGLWLVLKLIIILINAFFKYCLH